MAMENFGRIREVAEPPPQQEAAHAAGVKPRAPLMMSSAPVRLVMVLVYFNSIPLHGARGDREAGIVIGAVTGRGLAIACLLFAVDGHADVDCARAAIGQASDAGGGPVAG